MRTVRSEKILEEYITDRIKDIVTTWICRVSERENSELFSK